MRLRKAKPDLEEKDIMPQTCKKCEALSIADTQWEIGIPTPAPARWHVSLPAAAVSADPTLRCWARNGFFKCHPSETWMKPPQLKSQPSLPGWPLGAQGPVGRGSKTPLRCPCVDCPVRPCTVCVAGDLFPALASPAGAAHIRALLSDRRLQAPRGSHGQTFAGFSSWCGLTRPHGAEHRLQSQWLCWEPALLWALI